ncbi:hypothetical protein CCH79_00001823 [Gambusia affinis]|uniref:Oligodendrocyte transcription factor 3 n=1 Tax=Gambusia affinis TaxID=33528 RepID=A0A315VT20_GAMAF|nr:hypothetical protein CCH79_00001823 [Gambusia affinis]
MNSDSSPSSRASSPDMDGMFLRDHHPHHHHHHHLHQHVGSSVTSSTQSGEQQSQKITEHLRAVDAKSASVHPLLGGALTSSTSSTLSSALPGLTSMRAPHTLMKGSPAAPPALQLGSGFQHWAGLPCPCTICQVPPPPHIPITSTGLTRLTEEGKDGLK